MDELVALRGGMLPDRLRYLGFQPDDVTHVVRSARLALRDGEATSALSAAVRDLESAVGGHFRGESLRAQVLDELDEIASGSIAFGQGTLSVLALVAASDAVRGWQAGHGVDDEVTRATLSDLGRRVSLHRRSFGSPGLEDATVLLPHWQGALYELGRLQFELIRTPAGSRRRAALPEPLRDEPWLLRIRIPQTRPLSARAVDESLTAARPFFAKYFGDGLDGYEPRFALCTSWLLDPHFGDVLPEDTHVVRFQRRFTAFGTPSPANEDAVYFAFGHRPEARLPDVKTLRRDAAETVDPERALVQRIVADRIASGESWQLVDGWLELP
ncbi:MAG TPA: acyltransferase domain-containing protein [Actinomycetales bacterium]|nr:acyltransferase domain-containing protein [Actinomycetales bacterium]